MFNFFKKEITENDLKKLDIHFNEARIIIFKYLFLWFRQIFSTPEWKKIFFNKPDIQKAITAEVMRKLLVESDTRSTNELKTNETAMMAKKYVKKWADDVMEQDKPFRNFIIQTLKANSMLNGYFNGQNWKLENVRSKNIFEIIKKYNNNSKSFHPNSYRRILKKWIFWSMTADEKIKHK